MKNEVREVVQGATEWRDDAPYTPERRLFLELMSVGIVGALGALVAIPIIGVVLSPQLKAPSSVWRALGKVDKFKIGQTVEAVFLDASPLPWTGLAARNAVWLRRDTANSFTAHSIFCQHLGCPVRWEPGAGLFFCPCHGGVYYADGSVAAGPPPRGLQKYPTRVRRGQVEVYTEPIPVPY